MSDISFTDILNDGDAQRSSGSGRAVQVLTRLMWKEWAQVWPVFVTLAALAVLLVVIVQATATDANVWAPAACIICGLMVGMSCVAIATILFATEKETETAGFLQSTPVNPALLGIVKFVFGGVMLAGFGILMGSAVWLYAGNALRAYTPMDDGELTMGVQLIALGFSEVYVYCCFISLLVNRALLAAVLGLLFSLFMYFFTAVVAPYEWLGAGRLAAESTVLPTPILLPKAIGLLVFGVADLCLASRWLSLGWIRGQQRAVAWWNRWAFSWRWATLCFHLLWQSWRQASIGVVLSFVAFGLALLLSSMLQAVQVGNLSLLQVGAYAIATAVMASLVFWQDRQRDQRLFFHQHVERPRWLWLCRNLTWAVVIGLGGSFVFLLLAATATLMSGHYFGELAMPMQSFFLQNEQGNLPAYLGIALYAQTLATGMTLLFLAFSVGQFWSMFCRIPVLSIALSVITVGGLSLWMAWAVEKQFLLWWSVLPMAFAFLFATWWYAPQWITAERSQAWWWKPVVAIGGTLCVILLAVPYARVAQIEACHFANMRSSYGVEFSTAEAVRLSEFYEQALVSYRSPLCCGRIASRCWRSASRYSRRRMENEFSGCQAIARMGV